MIISTREHLASSEHHNFVISPKKKRPLDIMWDTTTSQLLQQCGGFFFSNFLWSLLMPQQLNPSTIVHAKVGCLLNLQTLHTLTCNEFTTLCPSQTASLIGGLPSQPAHPQTHQPHTIYLQQTLLPAPTNVRSNNNYSPTLFSFLAIDAC